MEAAKIKTQEEVNLEKELREIQASTAQAREDIRQAEEDIAALPEAEKGPRLIDYPLSGRERKLLKVTALAAALGAVDANVDIGKKLSSVNHPHAPAAKTEKVAVKKAPKGIYTAPSTNGLSASEKWQQITKETDEKMEAMKPKTPTPEEIKAEIEAKMNTQVEELKKNLAESAAREVANSNKLAAIEAGKLESAKALQQKMQEELAKKEAERQEKIDKKFAEIAAKQEKRRIESEKREKAQPRAETGVIVTSRGEGGDNVVYSTNPGGVTFNYRSANPVQEKVPGEVKEVFGNNIERRFLSVTTRPEHAAHPLPIDLSETHAHHS